MKKRLTTSKLAATVIALFLFALATSLSPAYALQPPRPGEIEQYKADGTYAERLERAERNGNHKFNPHVIMEANQEIKRLYMKARGQVYEPQSTYEVPPSWKSSFPSVGNPNLLVFLVEFPDYPHLEHQTVEEVETKMFGAGDPSLYPYESLSAFYYRSSYGKLRITGDVLGWYRADHKRSYYEKFGDEGIDVLIKEIFQHYLAEGYDFSKYDNDNDGVIDGFFIKWTGPDSGWSGLWWAVQTNFTDSSFRVNGKKLDYYCSSWYSNEEQEGSDEYIPRTDIHEMGHLLGLPDYYDYEEDVGPKGGIGGLDMMDDCYGDHNCFSKFVLGWLEPKVVASGTKNIILEPSGISEDAVLIMPDAQPTPFGYEFFMAQYRKRDVGNDPGDSVDELFEPYPADGLLIWHVDTSLDKYGDTIYDNSYSKHKLLRLMEADGREDIEKGSGWADAGDFYLPGKWFGPDSKPNSNDYKNNPTGIIINQLTKPSNTMGAVYSIGGTETEEPFLPGYEIWESRNTPDPGKVWKISFSKAVEAANVSKYIFITDANNDIINTSVTVDGNIVTIAPKSNYTIDKEYRLYVSQGLRSVDGVDLKQAIVMPFQVLGTTNIH